MGGGTTKGGSRKRGDEPRGARKGGQGAGQLYAHKAGRRTKKQGRGSSTLIRRAATRKKPGTFVTRNSRTGSRDVWKKSRDVWNTKSSSRSQGRLEKKGLEPSLQTPSGQSGHAGLETRQLRHVAANRDTLVEDCGGAHVGMFLPTFLAGHFWPPVFLPAVFGRHFRSQGPQGAH